VPHIPVFVEKDGCGTSFFCARIFHVPYIVYTKTSAHQIPPPEGENLPICSRENNNYGKIHKDILRPFERIWAVKTKLQECDCTRTEKINI